MDTAVARIMASGSDFLNSSSVSFGTKEMTAFSRLKVERPVRSE